MTIKEFSMGNVTARLMEHSVAYDCYQIFRDGGTEQKNLIGSYTANGVLLLKQVVLIPHTLLEISAVLSMIDICHKQEKGGAK